MMMPCSLICQFTWALMLVHELLSPNYLAMDAVMSVFMGQAYSDAMIHVVALQIYIVTVSVYMGVHARMRSRSLV